MNKEEITKLLVYTLDHCLNGDKTIILEKKRYGQNNK